MARRTKPRNVSVTMYNVGFGDCFLLSFEYADSDVRRVLIDCGTTSERKPHMTKVVDRILTDSGGHVDAVVVTHRHQDHLSAFGLAGLGKKLASLDPEVVIQPWTEHPEADPQAEAAPAVLTAAAHRQRVALREAQKFAAHLVAEPDRVLAGVAPRERRVLEKIAALSIPNKKAILCLAGMGKRRAYVSAGSRSGLEDLLPGVRVSVLGPPTLAQTETIRTQTQWDSDEFWKLWAGLAGVSAAHAPTAGGRSALFPRSPTRSIARAQSFVRWLVDKADSANGHNVRRIVRAMDGALNNTSVVLLFEVDGKGLLFPGDAQLENWQYALASKKNRQRLRSTALYKVGHHGSTNATPQSLWKLFRGRKARPPRLITLLSTEKGCHQGVPRKSLVDALEEKTDLYCTQSWRGKLSETITV